MSGKNSEKSEGRMVEIATLRSVSWRRGGTLLLWMGMIFLFSSFPGSGQPYDPPLWYFVERKGAHLVEYALLMLLAVRFFIARFPKETFWDILLLSGMFVLAYAATDELHQFFVPYRGAKMSDVLIDGIGMLCMAGLLWRLHAKASADQPITDIKKKRSPQRPERPPFK